MFMFGTFVFLVIGLATSQETSQVPETESTTSLAISTTELPVSTSFSTTPSKASSTSETPTDTTPKVPKSTPVPVTTKPPGPQEGSWNVTDGNVTCIRADLAIEFIIPEQNATIFLSPNATSTQSSCNFSNTTQALVLQYENYILAFQFEKDATSTYVRNVSFVYTSAVRTDVFYNDTKLFLVGNGNSYLCRTTDAVSLGNATMYIYKIHVQAFGSADETGFSKPEECELDDIVSDVIPIAVACALAGLIIVVLIAYLIGRRRNRQKGYTSV